QGAQTMTEALFQFGFEYEVVFANEALGIRGTLGPDERAAIALQRKDRKRSGREKMLIGPAAMRQFMRDIADDPGLAVIPVDRLDASQVAQAGARAICGDQQARFKRVSI